MTINEIAQKLVEYCRKGDWEAAFRDLYSPEARSIEPAGGPWPEVASGMAEIEAKGQQFNQMVEAFHGVEVTEPIVAGNHFSIGMTMDVTYKGMPRTKNSEICVYEVANGKIVKEQFFYPLPPQP